MPKLSSEDYESSLRSRFKIALAFAQGDIGVGEHHAAATALKISPKTLQRDIKRASEQTTFDAWRPGKRGPVKGTRRVAPEVFAVVEEHVYANASTKLNVAKLGRDVDHTLHNRGFTALDVPASSTLERLVKDIEAADPAHFANRRHGREGRRAHSLQIGSLVTTRPLEIVCIDHTPLDHRTFALGDEEVAIKPTGTAALDVHTGVCLAAFVSLFPPNSTTVALAMALSAISKTESLRAYGIPGEWEAGGLGETLYVDGGADLKSNAVQWGCDRHNIKLRVGWPGRPERRARMERLWGTLSSEVHSWEGTTLSNTVELNRHGGQKPAMWDLEEVQRRFLIAAMEYNNETYGGPKIPPIMQWRDQCSLAAVNRRIPRDPSQVFIDFLPYKTAAITFEGIRFANCFFRSGELAKLRYEGVDSTTIRYDPRDLSRLWIAGDRGYVAIPRSYPKSAPKELFALRHWGKRQSQIAQEKKDSELLRQLAAAKTRRVPLSGQTYPPEIVQEAVSVLKEWREREQALALPPTPLATSQGPDAPHTPDGNPGDQPGSALAPNFSIPTFKPRLK
ncbi:Mu transposase C-terminal domain-containing protein [Caulobacter hibisci]|uniref:Transposase n=1 Tax=Caulobacter hibisci TaxID=2035993 RepID=A0ABS0SW27_9CAUL|nr:Mu transposase C-terminal domain-containing protein [Caulobacter hibisci]MBI1683609.1 transposase [Caulobacter hibisci]